MNRRGPYPNRVVTGSEIDRARCDGVRYGAAMARKDLIDRLHERTEGRIPRTQLAALVDEVFDHVAETLMDEGRFNQPGFGTFTVQALGRRIGRNPRTGETIELAPTSTVRFKASSHLRDRLNG